MLTLTQYLGKIYRFLGMFLPKNISILICLAFLFTSKGLYSQHLQALNGSDHAGSQGVLNNPASSLRSRLPWDLTIFSLQAGVLTNVFSTDKPKLTQSSGSFRFNKGIFGRDLNAIINLNLLTATVKASNKLSFSVGSNIRSYTKLSSSVFNYFDSLQTPDTFFYANVLNQPLGIKLLSSSWLEVYGSAAYQLLDKDKFTVNIGGSLKLNRGLSGLYLNASDIKFKELPQGINSKYAVTSVDMDFGYSYTMEKWKSSQSPIQNIKNLVKFAESGYSLDLGFEIIIKDRKDVSLYDDTPVNEYKWKLGLSLLDLGFVKFQHGDLSIKSRGIKTNASGFSLEEKFDQTVSSLKILTDSLKTVVNVFTQPADNFNVNLPLRLQFNIDRKFTKYFYVNVATAINMASTFYPKKFHLSEYDIYSITPRFENEQFGIYVPFSSHGGGEKHVGAALKLGPILLGVDRFAIFSRKNNSQNTRVYFSLRLNPIGIFKKKRGAKSDKDAFRTLDSRSNESEYL